MNRRNSFLFAMALSASVAAALVLLARRRHYVPGDWIENLMVVEIPVDAISDEAGATEEATTDPAPAPEPPIDPNSINNLRQLQMEGEPDLVVDLIDSFVRSVPDLLSRIRDALAGNDAQALYKSAHTLKGSSGTIGAKPLASLCLAVETLAKMGTTDGAAEGLSKIEAEYARVKQALEQVRQQQLGATQPEQARK